MASSNGVLLPLNQQSQFLKRLDKICKDSLPTPLSQHCHVANLRDKILVIHTDSSLWATRLRLLVPALKHQWQANQFVPGIEQIEVKVRPL